MIRFIPTNSTGVITQFGKFSRLAYSGLNLYIPFFQSLYLISNKLCEHQSNLTVRTADKVFARIQIALQYKVKPQDSAKAYFQLSDPTEQMNSYTDNVVRKVSSQITLDALFESHSHIADAILQQVGPKMKVAGFTIESAQVRNIVPPQQIMKSMNEINASQRRKIAAQNDGEAAKIKAVLMAQAQAKEKQLRGKGIANMRSNITNGWVSSVKEMSDKTNTHPKTVLEFLVKILQQQTMENMSKHAGTKVIFVDKSSSQNLQKDSIIQALQAHEYKGQHITK